MKEKLKKFIEPIQNFWANLSGRAKKIILFSAAGVVVIAAVLWALLVNRPQYAVLYPSLDRDEAVQVTTELKDLGVDYKEDDGTVYVPADKENSLRMQLANEGHPKTGPNYDFFTGNVDVMTTESEKKVIEQYQLNQRLEDVIKTMDPIENAYVTISVPDKSDYAWDDKNDAATASVTLKMKAGQQLEPKQVNGIKQLVSKSVPNLTAANVSVVDSSSGEALDDASSGSGGDSEQTQIDLTEFKLKIEQQYEKDLEQRIKNHLAGSYGAKNVSVVVKSQMDLDKKIQDIITYQPTTSDGKGIVSESEEQHETVRNSASSGGVAGAQNNTEGTTTYPGVTVNGNTITTKDDATYKYLVSSVKEQIQSDAAALQDLTVSVIINGNALTARETDDVKNAVAFASGVDPAKVNVMSKGVPNSVQPANTQPAGFALPDWRILVAAGAAFLVIVVLTAALLAARRRKRARELEERLMPEGGETDLEGIAPEQEAPQEEPAPPEEPEEEPAPPEEPEPVEEPEEEPVPEEEEPEEEPEEEAEEVPEQEEEERQPEEEEEELPTESIEEIRQSASSKEEKLRRELQDFSLSNPEIAAQLIRSMLKGDDGRG